MHPQIFLDLGSGYHITSYRLFMVLFALSASLGAYFLGSQRGLNRRSLLTIIVLCNLSALLGSRLLYLISHEGLNALTLSRIFDVQVHYFSLYGGLLLASATGFVASRFMGISPWLMGDVFAPGLGLGLAFAKIGCFLNGCCFGRVSSLPWAVSFQQGSQAFAYQLLSSGMSFFTRTVKLHPVQLYEAAAALSGVLLCFVAFRYSRRVPGLCILILGLWFTAWRWFLFQFRAPTVVGPIEYHLYPVLYAVLVVLIAALFFRQLKHGQTNNLDL